MAEPERRALLSVADRTGIVELAYALKELGFALSAFGGTASALRQAEVVFEELKDMPRHARGWDLVAVNLYPLAQLVADSEPTQEEVLASVDLAGSALLRAAARDFTDILVLCDPNDYQAIVELLRRHKRVLPDRRQSLAAKAFHYGAYYDTTVAQYLGGKWERLPEELVIGLKKSVVLHYGENPQQQAALYTFAGARPWGLHAATVVQGKPLSYNHYLDLETAWELAIELVEPACAIVKHAVPAGAACAEKLSEAAKLAYRCDPRGCQRGTAAVNRELDEDAAAFLADEYLGLVAAPSFSEKALRVFKAKKDIRLVTLPSTLVSAHEMDLRAVAGGVLLQDRDQQSLPRETRAVTKRAPTETEALALRLAWRVAKYARTHAAVICRGSHTLGIGSGQTSRMDAVRLALVKSQERHPILPAGLPLVLASDAYLSDEHVLEAAQGGITAIIQPGGSSEDRQAVAAADEKSVAMLFTGVRHYRH